jgi:hypothetical protein
MAMTERHDDPAGSGQPISTGEFRATPDISASTAQFQAFAENSSEPARSWQPGVPDRNSARLTALIVGAVIVLAIVLILIIALA